MNEHIFNFFNGNKQIKPLFIKEISFRYYILFVGVVQWILIKIIPPAIQTGLSIEFSRVSNVIAIIGVIFFALTFLNRVFKIISVLFFFVFNTFIFLFALTYLAVLSFNVIEIIIIIAISSFLTVTQITKRFWVIIATIVFAFLSTLIFLFSPNGVLTYLVTLFSSFFFTSWIQIRSITQFEISDSIQSYLHSITDSQKDFYLIVDNNKVIKGSNQFALTALGSGYIKSLEGYSILEFIDSEFQSLFQGDFLRAINENIDIEREVKMNLSNGKTIWTVLRMSKIRLNQEVYVSVIANDISRIKDSEFKLKETLTNLAEQTEEMGNTQRAMLNMLEDIEIQKKSAKQREKETRTILENIADAVIVLDQNRNILLINKATTKLSGFTEEELIGKRYEQFIKIYLEKDNTIYTEYLDSAYAGKVIITENKYILLTKANEKVNVTMSIAPTFNKKNQVEKCVLAIKDVTKIRQVEKMKDEFVSIASHQLRTPLTAIKWHSELINDQINMIPQLIRPSVNFISDGSERLIHLVSELLDVSRIDTGRNFDLVKTDENIVKIVLKILQEVSILAENKEISFEKNFKDTDIINANVDAFKIGEAISNLITNAIKYSKKDSVVRINIEIKNDLLQIDVVDSGMGIPKSEQDNIFKRFYRAKNAITTEGTGLGLYITKSIVEAHNGTLSFVSLEKKGTTFTIKLPVNIKS